MTPEQIQVLHNRIVKAAMQYERATPGTRTKALREQGWMNLEAKLSAALLTLSQPKT